jgi:hydrogenase nickel incorporation protein HypA/HybF
MHEQSIVASLLSMTLERAEKDNAKKIICIRLVVGELTGVEKDAVNFYFGFMAKGTMAEGASIEYEYRKPQLRCRDCNIIFPREGLRFECPQCNKPVMEIVGGRELYIDSMEII